MIFMGGETRMNEKFFDLSREKQDRMINGALEVFAKNGFKHASTDDMVKAVDVSKGLWFHYFGSKAGIYTFVYGYSVKYMVLEISNIVKSDEKNYFEIMKKIESAKMKISKNYPYMSRFLEQAQIETDTEIIEQTSEDRNFLRDRVEGMIKNSEIPGVEDKARRDKIKKIVQYTIQGIERDKARDGLLDPEGTYREIKNYLDIVYDMTTASNSHEGNGPIGMIDTVA